MSCPLCQITLKYSLRDNFAKAFRATFPNFQYIKTISRFVASRKSEIMYTAALKVAPYNFSKKNENGTLVYNIFRQIYHLDESKQLIMINQRLEFTKRQRTIFKLTLL